MGGLDLTSGGNDGILALDILSIGTGISTPILTLQFTITDTANKSSVLAQSFATSLVQSNEMAGVSTPAYFYFNQFTGAANFTTVNSIALKITGPSAIDAAFTSIRTAPVPTPALLPGLVGLGVAVWRKRR